ncbi:hypothetical protein D3C72_1766570 [compost metagenome]
MELTDHHYCTDAPAGRLSNKLGKSSERMAEMLPEASGTSQERSPATSERTTKNSSEPRTIPNLVCDSFSPIVIAHFSKRRYFRKILFSGLVKRFIQFTSLN